MKRRHGQIILSCALIILALAIVAVITSRQPKPALQTVTLHGHQYQLEVASSDAAKQKGLGDRTGMPTDHGMLFPYAVSGQQCYWMKDMRFALDILWLDSAHKIVKIEPNLSPKTYPQSYCALSQYVIELNAGQAAKAGLHLGQTAYGL